MKTSAQNQSPPRDLGPVFALWVGLLTLLLGLCGLVNLYGPGIYYHYFPLPEYPPVKWNHSMKWGNYTLTGNIGSVTGNIGSGKVELDHFMVMGNITLGPPGGPIDFENLTFIGNNTTTPP